MNVSVWECLFWWGLVFLGFIIAFAAVLESR